MFDISFYKDKRVLITGHTGFKGSWMCHVLLLAGAKVAGYSLQPPTEPSLFSVSGLDMSIGMPKEMCWEQGRVYTIIGDVRNLDLMEKTFDEVCPEIVFHMAAQPLVRESYKDPVGTYSTNVMGTVNVLECVRKCSSVRSFVNITTDKVYLNREWNWGYRENEELNGFDPYSNSKSCSELVTASYKNSFFGGDSGLVDDGSTVAVSTMRAGNVIGGGDFAKDRIIPDCIRAVESGGAIVVRNPYSTRPYQHVLEPIMVYLLVAAKQYEDCSFSGSYNVGPDDRDCFETGNLVTLFCECWNKDEQFDDGNTPASWVNIAEANAPHEANFLKLDCSKLKHTFGWKPVWNLEEVMEKIVEWTKVYISASNRTNSKLDKTISSIEIVECINSQISDFMNAFSKNIS